MGAGPGPIGEIDFDPTALNASLRAGLEQLDLRSQFTLAKYTRVVLPADGFVFWKPTGGRVTVNGSLHFAQEWLQEADQAVGSARVILTSEQQIQEFAQPGQNAIWVGTYQGQLKNSRELFRYAFSAQAGFYGPAGLWHYVGYQIPPALLTQLLGPGNPVDQTRAVVSNSLPLWLGLNSYASLTLGATQAVPIYPSYQAAENATAPYAVVDVLDTEALQAAPALGVYGTHTQWCKDTCRVTLYGLQNNEALVFQDFINQYSLETDAFGLMNMPVVKDVHRVSAELHGLAMKKELLVEVSYDHQVSTTRAYQRINEVLYDFYVNPLAQAEEEGMILIPATIAEQSLTGPGGVAGLVNDAVIGTAPNAAAWARYAGAGEAQALNLMATLAAVNNGSGVNWSFLQQATLLELEWRIQVTLDAGETSANAGVLALSAQGQDAAARAYSAIGAEAPADVAAPPAAVTQLELTGRTVAPVANGVVNLTAAVSLLKTGANAFSSSNSRFSVYCRVVGYQN